jgi:hypothetical protein
MSRNPYHVLIGTDMVGHQYERLECLWSVPQGYSQYPRDPLLSHGSEPPSHLYRPTSRLARLHMV